ncbi:MAG: EAL domain-containing protein [Gammaproteobacteria bacterium]|nr:EAL domain-containing protein [Gammaproteobacteria bacterium]
MNPAEGVVKIGLLIGEGVLSQAVISSLAARGLDCRIAATLTEAERTTTGEMYDLLVVDAAIYGSESPAACRRLSEIWPDCPLILLTEPRQEFDSPALNTDWQVLPISDRKRELLPQLLLLVAERFTLAADSVASRTVLQAILDSVQDGFMLTNSEGQTLYQSPSAPGANGIFESIPLRDDKGNFFGAIHHASAPDSVQAFAPARDPGTGLVCRETLVECLGNALARVTRSGGRCALLLLDYLATDHDGANEPAMRAALSVAGRKLAYQLRRGDLVARVAPSVFAIVLEGVDTVAETARVAQKLLKVAALTESRPGRIGIAISPDDGDDSDGIMQAAEAALVKACAEKSPGYAYLKDATARDIARFIALSEGLDDALARNEFDLHFQPQFDLESRVVTGFEALLRWEHAEMGSVSPAEFVPVLERNGLINETGAWVIDRACKQLAAWQKEFSRPDLNMAVNLSPSQLEDDALISVVSRALAESGVAPEKLELEVTEGLLMKDPTKASATLRRLTKMGTPIAIDDFGTGYSSLAYIKMLPVSALKIDRTFMQGVPENDKDVSVVKGTIALAKGLDLVVTAEGVETHEQVECLQRHHCDRVQGFLFGKPRAAAEAQRFLTDGPSI